VARRTAPPGGGSTMKPAQVLALAGVAVFAIVLAFALGGNRQADPGGDRLLPALEGAVNDVDALVIQPGGAPAIRIERGEAAWTVPAHHRYPADAGKVRRLVLALADARVLETKTSNPDFYARLGVEDASESGGGGAAVSLEGVDGTQTVIVGNREIQGDRGTYVRIAGEPAARLVDQAIVVETASLDWLDREVMDVPAARVSAIEISHPDGDRVSIARDEAGTLALASVPVSGPTAADALARALAALRFDDVQPASGLAVGDEPVTARFTLDDGTVIEAASHGPADATWTTFTVIPAEVSDEPGSATRLAARVEGWAYRLPAWKAEQLARRLDDLLKPRPDGN